MISVHTTRLLQVAFQSFASLAILVIHATPSYDFDKHLMRFTNCLMNKCVAVCVSELDVVDSCLLTPRGTQNKELVCFHVLLQTIGQMVMLGPRSL